MEEVWSHLSNAKHIGDVFASLNLNEDYWGRQWKISTSVLGHENMHAAYKQIETDARKVSSHEMINNITASLKKYKNRGAARAAHGVVASLIAHDCSHLLYSNPEEVLLLAKLGNAVAIKMYPASLIFFNELLTKPIKHRYIRVIVERPETEVDKKLSEFLSKL